MAIPDFQTLMRPILAAYDSGADIRIADVRDALALDFSLTADELELRLPSGAAKTWNNRCGWATSYLSRVGLLERRSRGVYRITARGRDMLAKLPARIDLTALAEFPELEEFRTARRDDGSRATNGVDDAPTSQATTQTPAEQMEAAATELRSALVAEIRESIMLQSPAFFETLVLDVLVAMGYGGSREDAAERLGRSGDGGLDGVIREDRLGLDLIYVQAKRWDGKTVGRPDVQGFVGALQGVRAGRGVMITASKFAPSARAYADDVTPRVVLIDGTELAELMIEHAVGVSTIGRPFWISRLDSDYFTDEPA